jgi:hypothetical protein
MATGQEQGREAMKYEVRGPFWEVWRDGHIVISGLASEGEGQRARMGLILDDFQFKENAVEQTAEAFEADQRKGVSSCATVEIAGNCQYREGSLTGPPDRFAAPSKAATGSAKAKPETVGKGRH